jgi:hypothetical protein
LERTYADGEERDAAFDELTQTLTTYQDVYFELGIKTGARLLYQLLFEQEEGYYMTVHGYYTTVRGYCITARAYGDSLWKHGGNNQHTARIGRSYLEPWGIGNST